MKILENFGEIRRQFEEKFKILKILSTISIEQRKVKKDPCRILREWTKNEGIFEQVKENFDICEQNHYGKYFSWALLNIYWISASSPKVSCPER